ncbi:putative membrane protein [Geomicrobium halophilum]|uniref:Putative membrane protein n=1 Tax=Geomicrobium halophilum TaxID=549000 RepID=A0A841Q081_9BACL|nr:hypothetical protein [Geomicrobium halophilum]MBB6450505.1 putative membrane protein [Geomicrobium halophilum]
MSKTFGLTLLFISFIIAFLHMTAGIIAFGLALCLLSIHHFKQEKREWFVAIVYLLLGITLMVLAVIFYFAIEL